MDYSYSQFVAFVKAAARYRVAAMCDALWVSNIGHHLDPKHLGDVTNTLKEG